MPLKLTIPLPAEWINLNQRLHWAQRAKLTKAWRTMAHIQARQQRLPKKLGRVSIVATVHKATARKYDVHNLIPTAKAVIDGLVDYGLIVDDSNEFLVGPDMRAGDKGTPRIELLIIPEFSGFSGRIEAGPEVLKHHPDPDPTID